jgi:dienelactone hydrolase
MIVTETLEHTGPDGIFAGTVSYDNSRSGPRPGVLVAHAFGGQGDFDTGQARDLAKQGYIALAIDMYGKGRRASTPQQASALMHELNDRRPLVARRMRMWLEVLKQYPGVDPDRTAAIGFCFGGKCVLDLARSGAALRGVAGFHAVLDAPDPPADAPADAPVRASVLLLHGRDDPIARPDEFCAIAKELTRCDADWQMVAYGKTGHAFTNPAANSPADGMMFNPRSDARAHAAMTGFLKEILQSGPQ